MFTITQIKNGITNEDNKREQLFINESILYGFNDKMYNKNEMIDRIIYN